VVCLLIQALLHPAVGRSLLPELKADWPCGLQCHKKRHCSFDYVRTSSDTASMLSSVVACLEAEPTAPEVAPAVPPAVT
jgi:hypothetical protein